MNRLKLMVPRVYSTIHQCNIFFLSYIIRFILDGLPATKSQVDLLSKFQIVPISILELDIDTPEILKRGENDRHSLSRYVHPYVYQKICIHIMHTSYCSF